MTVKGASLDEGVQFEEPDALIRWGAPVAELMTAFTTNGLGGPRRVTAGYYAAACRLFGGLKTQVGFHFAPQSDEGALKELELFDNGQREIEQSYQLFHQKLVERFGPPKVQRRGTLGVNLPHCEWRMGAVSITHYAMDRFGPEEHLNIRKDRRAFWRNMFP